jgi:hypothetical protein
MEHGMMTGKAGGSEDCGKAVDMAQIFLDFLILECTAVLKWKCRSCAQLEMHGCAQRKCRSCAQLEMHGCAHALLCS